MDWGMKNRMSRLIRPDTGGSVMLAVDHGYFLGPTTGLEKVGWAVKDLVPHADALALTRGVLRHDINPGWDVPIILRVSGGTSILNEELLHEGITASMKDAVRLNVSGVAFSICVGAKFERTTILGLSQVVDEAEEHGIPTLAVIAIGKDMVRDARYLALAGRIAAEHGARIVKTYYCEPDFGKVVDTCPVPIVIAGGKKLPEMEALEMAYKAMEGGAVGVDMGRNIFQSENPVAMIKAVREVVHKGATGKEAFEAFQQLKSQA
ncbi:MAG: 3-hydroxy-5-phosphonooxypentane-2,4-dione thiolase [Candidatus Aenigmarchaeota archaeon]|nr:3-hydroxy-5-phosphonooxypentane-2,4-dione thiolase [Candidatus Aenigmarchaeota archaeon]